jgi:hypothetical protein
MPNWCDCELSLRGKNVKECVEAIQGEPGKDDDGYKLDFNKIVPMPAILEGTVAGYPADAGLALLDDEKGLEMLSSYCVQRQGITDLDGLRKHIRELPAAAEYEKAGKHALQAKEETGYYNWHDWCDGTTEKAFQDGHWGTKWNACYCTKSEKSETSTTIGFLSAWSPPSPVVKELAKQYPHLTITLRYWEGGVGFRGTLVAKGNRTLKDATYEYSGPRGG